LVDKLQQFCRTEGAAATITVQPFRGNISVLMGSGVAVLPGREGELLMRM
jgi:hypothetical protein